MFGMFFCFCYVIWTAILVVVRPALLKGGGLKESYGELSFLFSFLFSLRWSVCPLFLQERITGLHFFSSSVSRLRQKRSEGCTVFAAHAVRSVSAPVFAAVHLSSVYIHSKLYMLVFIFFFK